MFRRFLKEELGLEMVEWAVVAVGIVIAAILVFGQIGSLVQSEMGKVKTHLENEPAADTGGEANLAPAAE